jgi:hypothetical protein
MSTVIWCGFVSKWSMAPNFGPFSCRTWRDSIIFIFSFLGSKFLRRMDMGMDQDARFSVWMRGWTSTTTSCFGDWCRSFDPCWYAACIYYNYILVSRLCLPWLRCIYIYVYMCVYYVPGVTITCGEVNMQQPRHIIILWNSFTIEPNIGYLSLLAFKIYL